jgi:acyl phosphate:glycerol-3-phosphate acyltransferase
LLVLFLNLFFSVTLVYLFGTFPSGKIVSRFYGKKIESEGSGNVGATNVGRVIGKKAGFITLALDILKGYLGVCLAAKLGLTTSIGLLTVVLGHCFSLPSVKGGKGVATSIGAMFYYNYLLALVLLGVFGFIFRRKRIVSLASISSALALMLVSTTMYTFKLLEVYELESLFMLSLVVIYRHKDNIVRLIHSEEVTFSAKN